MLCHQGELRGFCPCTTTEDEMSHIWIVEMWMETPGHERWDPTIGVRFTRDDGQSLLENWRDLNPDSKFRLVKYVRAR